MDVRVVILRTLLTSQSRFQGGSSLSKSFICMEWFTHRTQIHPHTHINPKYITPFLDDYFEKVIKVPSLFTSTAEDGFDFLDKNLDHITLDLLRVIPPGN